MFLCFIEIFVIIIVSLIVLTQMLIPLIRGRMTFPILRKQGDLEKELANIRQKVVEKKIQRQIKKEKN